MCAAEEASLVRRMAAAPHAEYDLNLVLSIWIFDVNQQGVSAAPSHGIFSGNAFIAGLDL